MDIKEFHQNILNDVRIELTEEFDRNFERKAFFDKTWTKNKLVNRRGSMMARTNNLRRSMRSKISGDMITYSSSLPYASIQNEGGEITVTAKMKRYFWAMYYQATGSQRHDVKKTSSNSARNERLSIEAQQWKSMALMPVGKKLKIPSRRFIGDHPELKRIVEESVNRNLADLNDFIIQNLRQQ